MHNKERSELEHVWAVIGHDLATPLQVIHTNLKHLDKELLPRLLDIYKMAKDAGLDVPFISSDKLGHYHEILLNTQSVVDGMRQKISRWNHQLLSQHFHISNHPVEIVKCIKEAIDDYQTSYSFKDKSRIHLDLKESMVSGNQEMIQFIIFELLTNAEYAIESIGSDENISVFISSRIDDHKYHVKIKNQCLPIDSSEVEHYFSPYFSKKTSHIGLGLTFCKQAMQNMQGNITCNIEDNGRTIALDLTFQLANY